jgi:hypothetical protein
VAHAGCLNKGFIALLQTKVWLTERRKSLSTIQTTQCVEQLLETTKVVARLTGCLHGLGIRLLCRRVPALPTHSSQAHGLYIALLEGVTCARLMRAPAATLSDSASLVLNAALSSLRLARSTAPSDPSAFRSSSRAARRACAIAQHWCSYARIHLISSHRERIQPLAGSRGVADRLGKLQHLVSRSGSRLTSGPASPWHVTAISIDRFRHSIGHPQAEATPTVTPCFATHT